MRKLFKDKSDKLYFRTKRFDRPNNKRLHVHTATGLMHDNFRAITMDYNHLMDCAFRLENNVNAYRKVFRLAALMSLAIIAMTTVKAFLSFNSNLRPLTTLLFPIHHSDFTVLW